MLGKKSALVLGGTVTVTAETMSGIQRLDVWIIPVWLQNPCQNRICNSSEFFFLQKSDRKHSWGLLMFGYSAGKSDAKSEEPVDWSFAVLELLREQGWDVKEMNDRYKRVIYWDPNLADPWKENKKLVKSSSSSSSLSPEHHNSVTYLIKSENISTDMCEITSSGTMKTAKILRGIHLMRATGLFIIFFKLSTLASEWLIKQHLAIASTWGFVAIFFPIEFLS